MGHTLLNGDSSLQLEQLASNVLLTTGLSREQLRKATPEQLLSLQTQLLMGNTWGAWEVAPNLISRAPVTSHRCTFFLASAIPEDMDPECEAARRVWGELIRIAIAGRLWSSSKARRHAYSTIHTNLRSLSRVTRRIAGLDEPGFWSRATRDQVCSWLGRSGIYFSNLISRLHREGILDDAPVPRPRAKGPERARDRTGEPEIARHIETQVQWQPFPDAFTAHAGWCAIQMIQLVGPTLLDALEAASEVAVRTNVDDVRSQNHGRPASSRHALQIKASTLDPVIAQWKWTAPDGSPLTTLPMDASFRSKSNSHYWPPRSYNQARLMLTALQACHLWPVAFALAGRHAEILSLKEDCIRRETSHTPTGVMHTTKLDGVAGRDHESPIPTLVVLALQQQKRLARLIKNIHGIDGDHLWVKTTVDAGHPLTSFSNSLEVLVSTFELSSLLEGTSIHMHRFRKTLVRIIALALVHAPKILMDVLGHRDEQMTILRYILSDPGLLDEIQETVRELIILKGVHAVQKRDELQGKAAPVLRDRVAKYAKRMGSKAMEPQNLLEFVRAMTENGSGWAVIAPGIICTGFTRGGLCNKGQGGANPHYCNPACDNQLVLSEYDEDGVQISSAVLKAIETVDYMLGKLREADTNGEDMLIAQFAGQVKAMLGRWREVDQHFSDHPVLNKHLPNVVLLP